MEKLTADLYDEYADQLKIAEPIFRDFGRRKVFCGEIVTVKVFEDNVLVKKILGENGSGKVLVVDGGGSLRCALLGDNLASLAKESGWDGLIIYGCIRDSAEIATIEVGVKALNTHPAKSIKKGEGDVNIPVSFSGVTFNPGEYVYADEDGVVLSTQKLS